MTTELEGLELVVGLLAHGRAPEERAAIWREARCWQLEHKIAKLRAIAQEQGIDTTHRDWLISLAEKAYLQPPKRKRGRPRGSTKIVGGIELVKAIELNRRLHKSVLQTCEWLTRHLPPWRNQNPRSLQTQYYQWLREVRQLRENRPSSYNDSFFDRLEHAALAARNAPRNSGEGLMFKLAEIGRSLSTNPAIQTPD
jgi:hypothetical protein